MARAIPDIGTPLRRMRFTLADLEQLASPWRSQRLPAREAMLVVATIDALTGLLLGSSA